MQGYKTEIANDIQVHKSNSEQLSLSLQNSM